MLPTWGLRICLRLSGMTHGTGFNPSQITLSHGAEAGAPPSLAAPSAAPAPQMSAPTMPSASPPIRGTEQGDQLERSRLLSTGPGINQIHSKIENSSFGQNHPALGKILGWGAEIPLHIAEAAGSMLGPTSTAEGLLPGTTAHHAMELRNLNSVIGKESEENLHGAQQGAEEARTGLEEAQTAGLPQQQVDTHASSVAETGLHNAQVAALLHPQAKTEFEAWQQQNPGKPIEEWLKAQQAVKPEREESPTAQTYDDLVARGIPREKALELTKERPVVVNSASQHEHEGQDYVVPDGQGGHKLVRIYPGEAIPEGAQTQTGLNALNTPTTQQRTAAGRAATVVAMAPEVLSEIDRLGPSLGPIAGRWNDFMQGKVGMDNPEFAGLRTLTS